MSTASSTALLSSVIRFFDLPLIADVQISRGSPMDRRDATIDLPSGDMSKLSMVLKSTTSEIFAFPISTLYRGSEPSTSASKMMLFESGAQWKSVTQLSNVGVSFFLLRVLRS